MISARDAFLARLIDDAGLFPPASLSVEDALAADLTARAGHHASLVGRFIVGAARVDALATALVGTREPLELSVIVDPARAVAEIGAALERAETSAGSIVVRSIETRLPAVDDGDLSDGALRTVADVDASGLVAGGAAYVEFAFGERYESRVDCVVGALADARGRSRHDVAAKIRCGGVVAEAVPSPEQLAYAIGAFRGRGVPFKATAGLHHPVRHFDEVAGYTVHGFLNVIGAAVLDWALDLDERTRREIIAETDARQFALDEHEFRWRDLRVDGPAVAAARAAFVHSYGSCSLTEPVDDLVALGILEQPALR